MMIERRTSARASVGALFAAYLSFGGSAALAQSNTPLMNFEFVPSATEVQVGEVFSFTLQARPTDIAPSGGGYGSFFVAWNGSNQNASFASYSFDSSFSGGATQVPGFPFFGTNGQSFSFGQSVAFDDSTTSGIGAAQRDGFDYITVNYVAAQAGTFSLNNVRFTEIASTFGENIYELAIERNSRTVNIAAVSPVPEPSSFALLGIGLLGLWARSRYMGGVAPFPRTVTG